ncbi:MAG: 30S ribosomal protein S4 [bacterium]
MLKTERCKQCRREGKKLFLKGDRCNSGKCSITKRNYKPGMHGNKTFTKLTAYGIQLREKQQAKRIYGINETQLRNYYDSAMQKKGDTGAKIIDSLERRMDNVIYRLGIARSRKEARQLVKHGFFVLNGKKADIPSMQVKMNDIINFKKTKEGKKVAEKISGNNVDASKLPSWLVIDIKNKSGKVVGDPKAEEVNPIFDLKAIVEFYSR